MITIKNLKYDKPTGSHDFKIDRSSPVGNPFVLSKYGNREQVIKKYKTYFDKQITKPSKFKDYIDMLIQEYLNHNELNLYCWCSPLPCHGDIIKDYILTRGINTLPKINALEVLIQDIESRYSRD